LRTYQTIIVIDSLLKVEEIDAVIEKVVRIINNNGGEVKSVDRWEKKRLAYEIKNRQYGYYVEIQFEAPGNLVKILERDYRLDENILRYLTIVLDNKALAFLEQQKQKKQKLVEEDIPEIENDLIDDFDEEENNEIASVEKIEQESPVEEISSESKTLFSD
jgi:small subunit ribosomal protein S6